MGREFMFLSFCKGAVMHRTITTFSFLLVFSSSTLFSAGKPPILFLKTAVNYAWGYSHSGFFIDSTGTVFTYSFEVDDSIPDYLFNDSLPDGLCDKLLEKGLPTGKTVTADSLNLLYGLADSAAAGELTGDPQCVDAGKFRYSILINNPVDGNIKQIICFQMGDQSICNASSAAKTVARWMLTAIDSTDLTTQLFCAPDSCLNVSTAAAIPLPVHPVRAGNNTAVSQFYLNGKKGENKASGLIVDKNGKRPIRFTSDMER